MKKRHALNCERLERRELPANSLGVALFAVDFSYPAQIEAQQEAARAQAAPAITGNGALFATVAESGLTSDAVGAFFADRAELGRLFPSSPAEEPEFESIPAPGWSGAEQAGPAPQALAPAQEVEFWNFLRNYATKAIRREEQARGPLNDHADIIQQIYVEWRDKVPSGPQAHLQLLDKDSAERAAFRGAVRRVLDRTRYEAVKQRRRTEATDQQAPENFATRDWADLDIDLAQGIGKLTDRERDILDLRRWGLTFEEIGARLGMPRQRAFEAYSEVLDRLTAIYRD